MCKDCSPQGGTCPHCGKSLCSCPCTELYSTGITQQEDEEWRLNVCNQCHHSVIYKRPCIPVNLR